MSAELLFSTIKVTSQAFYRSSLSFAIVNLKPIVPGHVLVIPKRPVARLYDLNENELSSLMNSVTVVGRAIEKAYGADSLTIACQDGKAAGQSVLHCHFHILPRKFHGDKFSENNDAVYPEIDRAEKTLPSELRAEALRVDADENRKARSQEEMEAEATWLKTFFE